MAKQEWICTEKVYLQGWILTKKKHNSKSKIEVFPPYTFRLLVNSNYTSMLIIEFNIVLKRNYNVKCAFYVRLYLIQIILIFCCYKHISRPQGWLHWTQKEQHTLLFSYYVGHIISHKRLFPEYRISWFFIITSVAC